MQISRIILVGFGRHAKRIYQPIISSLPNAQIVGVVDLQEEKEALQAYLSQHDINTATLFVRKNDFSLTKLSVFAKQLGANVAVISTDPENHVIYATWALKSGLHVLMDKPVHAEPESAHDVTAARCIHLRYQELLSQFHESKEVYPHLKCIILTQRRYHPAYRLIRDIIKEVFEKTGSPITYYYSFHNDGQWRLPKELATLEYHGFNKGFGKASHSGYHFYDLLNWFSEPYRKAFCIDRLSVKAWPNFPNNYYRQVTPTVINSVFQDYRVHSSEKNKFSNYGEIDVMSTIQLCSEESTITHAQVDLLHSGISTRSWLAIEGRDLYKNNGRVRHEQHYINMGPFLAISLTSWQSKPFHAENIEDKAIFRPGHEFNLDISICRNSKLIGGKDAETISLRDIYEPTLEDYSRGHQEDARRSAIVEFFQLVETNRGDNTSSLESHMLSSMIMSTVYESIASKDRVVNRFV